MVWEDVKNLEIRFNGLIAAVEAMQAVIKAVRDEPDMYASCLRTVDSKLAEALARAKMEG